MTYILRKMLFSHWHRRLGVLQIWVEPMTICLLKLAKYCDTKGYEKMICNFEGWWRVLEVKQLGWYAKVVPQPPSMKKLVSSNTKQGLKQGQSTNTGSPTLQPTVVWIQWALSIQLKIPEISDGTSNGTDHFRNIRDQLWRWSSLTGPVISVGWTEMSLSIWQNCCPQYRSFVLCNQTLGSGLCNREGLFHWARGISEISNRNFCWMESAQHLSHIRKTNEG